MSTQELVTLIKQVKRQPVERDTLYNVVKDFSEVVFTDAENLAQMD
jgi:aminodeoxyfutalosine synthase